MSPRRPNLFIVGAPKCGTTAWVEYLRTHPDIFFPQTKEDCFFALDLPGFRTVHTEDEYAKLFEGSEQAKVRGEASVMYLFSETAAQAIRTYDPAAKILIFLRDQEAFLPSLHNQFVQEFAEEILDFETAWRLSGRRPPESIPPACLEPRTLDYAAMGRFAAQVGRYLDLFPPRQVRVIRFDEWVADPRNTYLGILKFLGLDDDGRKDFRPINRGGKYRSRRLVRAMLFPPDWARKIVRLVRRATGFQGYGLYPWMHKLIRSLTVAGYDRELEPRLREEIRAYYLDDNRRLDDLLASADVAESVNAAELANRTALA